MKTEFIAYLLADAGLTALVGTRIKWDVLTQGGAMPAICLHQVSTPRDYTMRGRVGLTGFLVQIDVWAATLASREAVVAALIAALDAITGDSPQVFAGAFIENQRDSFEPGDGPDSSNATNYFRASLDVRVWFTEA